MSHVNVFWMKFVNTGSYVLLCSPGGLFLDRGAQVKLANILESQQSGDLSGVTVDSRAYHAGTDENIHLPGFCVHIRSISPKKSEPII